LDGAKRPTSDDDRLGLSEPGLTLPADPVKEHLA
jgi:hypothetical protein